MLELWHNNINGSHFTGHCVVYDSYDDTIEMYTGEEYNRLSDVLGLDLDYYEPDQDLVLYYEMLGYSFYREYDDIKMRSIPLSDNVVIPEFVTSCNINLFSKMDYDNLKILGGEHLTNLSKMFFNAKFLKRIDLSESNIRHVCNANSMFNGCRSLEEVDLRNVIFHPIIEMYEGTKIFSRCPNLKRVYFSDEAFARFIYKYDVVDSDVKLIVNDVQYTMKTYTDVLRYDILH